VAWDVQNEKVSAGAARDDYGVVLNADGSVDDAATTSLRLSLRESQTEVTQTG
jgi:hypothetical protein